MDDLEQRELLYRIDEQTKHTSDKLDDLGKRIEKNEENIDTLQGKVQRNTTVLGAMGSGVTAALIWFADKVTRLV